jgi:hypothetical protein
MKIEYIFKNDYYRITKFVGKISICLVEFFGIKKPKVELFIRFIVGFLIFGSLGFGVPSIVGIVTGDYLIDSIEVFLLFLWMGIGVFLIDIGDYYLDDFWLSFKKISKLKKEEFEKFKIESAKMFFTKRYSGFISILAWLLACFAAFNEWSYHSDLVMIMIFILLIPAAVMWGIGAWTTIYTYYFMWKICKTKIKIDPFAPDNVGGLSIIAKFPIRLSFLLSSLSLYIPYGVARKFHMGMATQYWFINLIWEGIFFIILGLMIFTFFIPLIPIYRNAKNNKNNLLKKCSFKLNKMVKNSSTENDINYNIQTLILFNYYDVIKKMRLWPINVDMLLKFFGYILLPTIFAIIGIFLKIN